ncbi:hypothetical protein IFR05_017325, partial [Cadophora sp. M221]
MTNIARRSVFTAMTTLLIVGLSLRNGNPSQTSLEWLLIYSLFRQCPLIQNA